MWTQKREFSLYIVFYIYTTPVCSLFYVSICIILRIINDNLLWVCRLVEKESSKLLICKIVYQLIFNTFDQDLGLMS